MTVHIIMIVLIVILLITKNNSSNCNDSDRSAEAQKDLVSIRGPALGFFTSTTHTFITRITIVSIPACHYYYYFGPWGT